MMTRISITVCGLTLLLRAAGCRSIGPPTLNRDRMDYMTALSDSWKSQMLLNLVKTRYADPPVFLDVVSVISQYALETEVTGHAGWRRW